MRCATCASPIPEGGGFCTNCGADLSEPGSSAATLDDAGVGRLTRMLRQETAGEYEIEREIGRGGMGVVYLATEIQLRRRVAIKVLPPTLALGEQTSQRFRREARMAAGLDHPNIIPIHRVSSGGELMWYSMKLLEGKSLDAILKEKERLTFEETLAILAQVADALDYGHGRGVIHRDIKPGNIVLEEGGRVTVTDFGIAKEIREASVTTSGALLGTPFYMSPEQSQGGEISGAADQYSLAVVAYQCLAHRVPFDAPSAYELLHQHATAAPPPLATFRPDLPPQAYAAIERALAKRPEDRFATVKAFVDALAGRAVAPARPRRRTARRWITLGLVIAATGGTLVVLVATRRCCAQAAPRAPARLLSDTLTSRNGGDETSVGTSVSSPAEARVGSGPPPPPPAAQPRAAAALLIIRLSTGWARIYVDHELRGERPVHREELPPGTHTLRFERPGFLPVDTTLTLHPGQNLLEIRMSRVVP